ncbi:MAG: HAMP domain-containing protein, partial [Calditrichaeota bacterium]
MLRKLQSLRTRMLVSFLIAVLVMMFANSLITQKLTREALTRDLHSSLEVISEIAADAVAVGLEFQDADAVSSAVESFKKQALFSYISVQDKDGNEVYTYRRPGFEDLTNLERLAEGVSGDEMFQRVPVLSDSSRVGMITVGISLQGRNRVLRSAQFAQMWLTLAVIVLFVVITVIIANLISKPVRAITQIAQHLAEGDLDQDVSIHRDDEIGALADSFRHMIAAQREKAELAEQIARGNLDVKAEAICEKDVLGHAMATMKVSLATMLMELQKTIQAQKEGDLDARCHPEKLHGAYADLLRGVNEALDAVIHPIYEGIEVMQEYASGNLEREMRKLPGKQIV